MQKIEGNTFGIFMDNSTKSYSSFIFYYFIKM